MKNYNIDSLNERLKEQLAKKENQVKDLQDKLNKMMVVNFISTDYSVNCGIKCLLDETSAEVEEKLYKMYDEYRNTNSNYFICGGRIILRFKKLRENNIKDGDVIQLEQNEFLK